MKIPKFKIRCSCIGKIVGDGKGGGGLTDKQAINLKSLQDKEKRTIKQEQLMQELIAKRDAPPSLSATAKTYCEDWLQEQLYGRKKEIKSKYLDKGNFVEDESIEFISHLFFEDYVKNEEYFEDEFKTGTPDIIAPNLIIDMKNSWSFETFPLLAKDNPNYDYYYCQLQGYMDLCDKDNSKLIYTLMDTPDHLIEREIKRECYDSLRPEEEIRKELYEKMRYGDIDPKLRHKEFSFTRNKDFIYKVHEKVILCREYIEELVNQLKEEGKIC